MKNIFDNSQHFKGILAEWYDELYTDELLDIEYYKKIINNSRPPVLELACGTGRILLNLLKLGISVDGLDSSKEMLELCRSKVKSQKFNTQLYHQKMEELNIQKMFKTIFISGGAFQLLDSYELASETLSRIYKHLDEGGRFIADLYIPWTEIMNKQEGVWKSGGSGWRSTNSKFLSSFFSKYHLKRQVIERTYKYELIEDNKVKEVEISRLNVKWYSIQEFKLMLEKAGFTDIKTEEQNIMSSQGTSIVFFAYKKNS